MIIIIIIIIIIEKLFIVNGIIKLLMVIKLFEEVKEEIK